MKKQFVFGALFCALVIVSSSCNKKNKEDAITSDDAADAVSETMQYKSGGYPEDVQAAANYTLNLNLGTPGAGLHCGESHDSTITASITGSVTASYTHTWEYTLNCDTDSNPVSITGTGNHTGEYDGPRIHSNTNGTRNWTITGLGSSSADFIYNGSHSRSGVHTSKIGKKNTFTTSIQTVTSNVLVDKSTKHIVSGSATVNATCTSSSGKAYTFTGTLVFNGDETATLTLNGNTYTITFN